MASVIQTRKNKKQQVENMKSEKRQTLGSRIGLDQLQTIPCGVRRHGASHRGKKLNQWDETNMMKAITEFREQNDKCESVKISLRAIARAWRIPYATLRKRVSVQNGEGQSTTKIALHRSGRPTVLSEVEEEEAACHLRSLAQVGFPCTQDDVRKLAFEYATGKGLKGFSSKMKNAGYYWFQGFLARHKELSAKKSENLSIARAMNMNKPQVLDWFNKLKELCVSLGIFNNASHIWNADETGCQNICKSEKVVGETGKPTYNITATEKGETTTALVCINALGNALEPMIIHKGMKVGKLWSNGARHDVMVRASESGYINKDLFHEFGKSFIAFLEKTNLMDGLPHLLLLDSHYAHLYNLKFLELMKENHVHVFAIPPHTSHWLQPLDRGLFRSFKMGWQKSMKSFNRSMAGRKLEKKDFFVVFNEAWDHGITVDNAQGGFRGCGIVPWNPEAIPSHAYEPSNTTEREQTEAPTSDSRSDTCTLPVLLSSPTVRPNDATTSPVLVPTPVECCDVSSVPIQSVSSNSVVSLVQPSIVTQSNGLVQSAAIPVTFEQLLPLPHRERPLQSKQRARRKPPSYELTSASTLDFVKQVVEAKHSKTKRIKKCAGEKPVQTDISVSKGLKPSRPIAVEQRKIVKPRRPKVLVGKKAKDLRSRDHVPCHRCKVPYGDPGDQRMNEDWDQCIKCKSWLHETCAALSGEYKKVGGIEKFICDDCISSTKRST